MRNPSLCHSHPALRHITEVQHRATIASTSHTQSSTAGSSVTTTTTNSSFRSSSSSNRLTSENCTSLDDASSAEETPTTHATKQRRKSDQRRRSKDKPMLRIVQEMSEQRAVVVSTIAVNRQKVRRWQRQTPPAAEVTDSDTRRKASESKRMHSRSRRSRQRYISENFCNEYLDKNHQQHSPPHDQQPTANSSAPTVYTSSDNDDANRQHNNTTLPMAPETRQAPITFGKLQASPAARSKCNPRSPAAGKLMAKRIARHSVDSLNTLDSGVNRAYGDVPPAKPPRTFSSYTPSVISSTNDAPQSAALDSMTTLRVAEGRQKPAANGSKVVGWKCPPHDQQSADPNHAAANPFIVHEKFDKLPSTIGWAPNPSSQSLQPSAWTPPPKTTAQQQQHIPQQIVEMLHYDESEKVPEPMSSVTPAPQQVSIMTSTQRAVPQSPPREYIDEVDCPRPTVTEPACHNAPKPMEQFATGATFSTPQRHNKTNHDRLDELRRAVEFTPTPPPASVHPTAPDLDEIETQIIPSQTHCQNCARTKSAEDRVAPKKSFGKNALRRTKTFLEAGRHMLNRKSAYHPSGANRPPRPHSDVDVDWQQQLDCSPPAAKLDRTARKNRLGRSDAKRTDKALNLVGREVFSDGDRGSGLVVESPRRMYERFLASAGSRQQTPPKKPARAMHKTANRLSSAGNSDDGKQNDFDFQRTVASPMVAHRQTGAAASPSKTAGALLLLPKRLFGNASKARPNIDLNIVPAAEQSSSYKSFRDTDDGFAVFMAEYLRRMYEQIQREQTQAGRAAEALDETEDFVQLCDISDSECSNGVDVIPDRIRWTEPIQSAAMSSEEPLYSEIQKKADGAAATYAVVKKTPRSVANSPLRLAAALATKSSGNLFSQSVESLCLLNNTDDIDLVHSIEDFLGAQLLAGLRPKVGSEFKCMSEVMNRSGMRETQSTNDLDSLTMDEPMTTPPAGEPVSNNVVQATPGHERESPLKCEEYHQRSAAVEYAHQPNASVASRNNDEVEIYSELSFEPQLFHTAVEVHSAQTTSDTEAASSAAEDDRSSIGTYSSIVLTESICDEVLRGERMNDDICETMNRLQTVMNLTADGRYYAQAEPESSLDEPATLDEDDDRRNCTAPSERQPTAAASAVPKYRQFADSVRNSIRSSSRFFKTTSPRSAGHATPTDRQSAMRQAPADAIIRPSYMQTLNDQVAHQRQLRPQLLHAITICRSSADLGCSVELVEAERLLLLSHAKETAARDEMARIRCGDPQRRQAAALGSAMLEIRRLEVRLQSITADALDGLSKYYYVCVCSYRNQVQATVAQLASHQMDAGVIDPDVRLVFDGMTMRFVDMQPNFQLKIELFLLQLPHYATLAMSSNNAVSYNYHMFRSTGLFIQSIGRSRTHHVFVRWTLPLLRPRICGSYPQLAHIAAAPRMYAHKHAGTSSRNAPQYRRPAASSPARSTSAWFRLSRPSRLSRINRRRTARRPSCVIVRCEWTFTRKYCSTFPS